MARSEDTRIGSVPAVTSSECDLVRGATRRMVKSESVYFSFTIPSKSGDGQTDDPRTLTATPVGSFELSGQMGMSHI